MYSNKNSTNCQALRKYFNYTYIILTLILYWRGTYKNLYKREETMEDLIMNDYYKIQHKEKEFLLNKEIVQNIISEKNETQFDTAYVFDNITYWENVITQAILSDNIFPFYQKIVDIDNNVIKYEALMRLKRLDEKGQEEILTPDTFLEISKKTNQYNVLSIIMMKKVFEAMQKEDMSFSINISLLDIENEMFLGNLKQLVDRYHKEQIKLLKKVNPICFEIIEDKQIYDYDLLSDFINEFKDKNIDIAIDDFGSGYSSFMHLLKIKPNYLKLDGSLIKNIDTDIDAKIVVDGILKIAHELKIKIIAEYVHCKEIFDLLKKMGIDMFQGYFIGKPNLL